MGYCNVSKDCSVHVCVCIRVCVQKTPSVLDFLPIQSPETEESSLCIRLVLISHLFDAWTC